MEKITIELIDSAPYRLFMMKLNKMQEKEHKEPFTLEQVISMLLSMPDFLQSLTAINNALSDDFLDKLGGIDNGKI